MLRLSFFTSQWSRLHRQTLLPLKSRHLDVSLEIVQFLQFGDCVHLNLLADDERGIPCAVKRFVEQVCCLHSLRSVVVMARMASSSAAISSRFGTRSRMRAVVAFRSIFFLVRDFESLDAVTTAVLPQNHLQNFESVQNLILRLVGLQESVEI